MWFLVVALVPLIVVSVISYYTAKQSLREAAYDSVANAVEEKAAFFNNWFHYRLIDLESQATSISNTQFLKELHEGFKASGQAIGEFIKSYRWDAITDRRSGDLKTFRKLYGYHDVFLIDTEGNILFTVAEESDRGANLFNGPLSETRFAAACRRTLESGRPVFSDLEYYAPSNDVIAAFLADAIVDEHGEKIGVLAIQITSEQITYAMRSTNEFGEDIQAYVVGFSNKADGVTLRSKINVDTAGDDAAGIRDLQQDGSSRYLSQCVDTEQSRLWFGEHGPDGIERSDQTEAVFVYDGPDGTRVLGVHKNFSIAGVDWGLVAEMPVDVAFASANQLKNLDISLVLVTGVLVAVIAIVITRRIARPIAQLSEAAKRVTQGDLTQAIDSSATDEIGELCYSFNGMVYHLNKLFGDLSTLRSALNEHAIVSTTDIRGNIIHANDKFCEITGYSRDELIGQNHRMIKSNEHSPEFYRQLWKTIAGGRVWSGKIKNLAKDGSHYWVDASVVPVRNMEGQIEQYVAIRTDITYVKDAEEKATHFCTQLEQTNLELEGQREEAAAMNAELLSINAALEEARAEATQATKAKSNFLANMSHEIRTPMTAILGFSENLREGGLTESEQLDAIETIHSNGEYLLGLINDILDVSKIEAGKMEMEHISCSVQAILADVASLMKVRSDAKNLALNTEIIGPLPEAIQSDPTRLKQILINIIGNAIKFTDEGGVRLITRFVPGNESNKEGSTEEPHLQFDVVDTGVGLTEVQVGNLFQAFSQADSTMTRKFGGTGLGLTISKKFSEMLGGDLTIVDSQPGCGTRFRATVATGSLVGVKMIDLSIDAPSHEPAPLSKTSQTAKPLDCRILLAEDGPDNQRLICFILKKAGAEVRVAENGQIAFDQAMASQSEGKPFDVILMDMQMPVLDGYEATKTLRDKGYRGPIIALTAHAMTGDREKCIACGCDDFATKPIDREELIELIQQYVQAVPMQTG